MCSRADNAVFLLQKHEDTDCPCVVVSCPHQCRVQTLLRSEVRAWPGPARGLGCLQDQWKPKVFTGSSGDADTRKPHKTSCCFGESEFAEAVKSYKVVNSEQILLRIEKVGFLHNASKGAAFLSKSNYL